MEQKFIAAFEANRVEAEKLGARMRPVDVRSAKRTLSGSRTSAQPSVCSLQLQIGGSTMEQKFIAAFEANRVEAEKLGARMRPVDVKSAKRTLSGSRTSDGFNTLMAKGRLDLSLEALVVDKRFTALFTDEEANEALNRLLDAGFYRF